MEHQQPEIPHFLPGDIIQLRSGGPLLTATHTTPQGTTTFIYYNSVTGLFEKGVTHQRCLKPGNTRPENPPDAHGMRQTSVVKSSMSP